MKIVNSDKNQDLEQKDVIDNDQNTSFISKMKPVLFHTSSVNMTLKNANKKFSASIELQNNYIQPQEACGAKTLETVWRGTLQCISIHKWKEHKGFVLRFCRAELATNRSFNVIGREISVRLTHLRQLYINFWDCKLIDEYGLEKFGTHLGRNLISLQKLTLYFAYCTKVTNQGLKTFGSEVCSHLPLKYLDIRFYGCVQITDEGVMNLGSQIVRHLLWLKELKIFFTGSIKITSYPAKVIAKKICRDMHNLKSIDFQFPGCPKITTKHLEELKEYFLKNAPQLRRIALSELIRDNQILVLKNR